MAKPKPTTPPGRNSFDRTYQEQMDWEKAQKAKKIGQGEKNFLETWFDGMTKKKKSTPANMKNAKKAALKKKITSIPASPTN